jgi:hypothetical protein
VIIITIKQIIPKPRIDKLLIKTFHSLNSAPIIIIINKTVDIFIAVGSNESIIFLNLKRTTIPIATGIAVIRNIVSPKDNILSGGASAPMKYFIEKPVINGRVTMVIILTKAVYDIDNAVSPLANLVITFEVTPPGHDANIIMPTAISFVIPIKKIIKNAAIGSKII